MERSTLRLLKSATANIGCTSGFQFDEIGREFPELFSQGFILGGGNGPAHGAVTEVHFWMLCSLEGAVDGSLGALHRRLCQQGRDEVVDELRDQVPGEVAIDGAGVEREHLDVGAFEDLCELPCEDDISKFAVTVCLNSVVTFLVVEVFKVNFAAKMGEGRHINDAGRFTVLHLGQQEVGEEEVAEVVGAHLQLKALRRLHVRAHHHTSVVDENVHFDVILLDAVRELSDRLKARQVQLADLGPAALPSQLLTGRLSFGDVTAGEDDMRTSSEHVSCRLFADADVGPSDDHRLPCEPLSGGAQPPRQKAARTHHHRHVGEQAAHRPPSHQVVPQEHKAKQHGEVVDFFAEEEPPSLGEEGHAHPIGVKDSLHGRQHGGQEGQWGHY